MVRGHPHPSEITPAPRATTPHPMPSKKGTLAGEATEAHPVSGLSRKQKGTREHAGEEGGHAMGRRGGGEVGVRRGVVRPAGSAPELRAARPLYPPHGHRGHHCAPDLALQPPRYFLRISGRTIYINAWGRHTFSVYV